MVRRDTPGAQRLFLARVNAALRADSRRLRVAAPLRAAARRFRVIAAFWPGVSLALGLAFMGSLPLRSSVMLRPRRHNPCLLTRVARERKVKQCVTSFIKLAQAGYMERSRSKSATHSRRSLETYCHKLPFCRGKIAFGTRNAAIGTSSARHQIPGVAVCAKGRSPHPLVRPLRARSRRCLRECVAETARLSMLMTARHSLILPAIILALSDLISRPSILP